LPGNGLQGWRKANNQLPKRTPNSKQLKANSEQRMANGEQRMANGEWRIANSEKLISEPLQNGENV
jgi:hypothetical protein